LPLQAQLIGEEPGFALCRQLPAFYCQIVKNLYARAVNSSTKRFEKIKLRRECPAKNALVAGAFGVTVSAAMKTLSAKAKISGLTLIEVLVVLAVLFVLAALLLPSLARTKSGRQVQCLYNQKQIAMALIMFNDDHAGKYPWQDSVTNGLASTYFQTLSAYLGNQPNPLICFSDKTRHAAVNFSGLQNENISYFLNLDATTNAADILTGDRHLEVNGNDANSGRLACSTNSILSWASGFHLDAHGRPIGALSFVDGHAQFVGADGLNLLFRNQSRAMSRLCVP
jgi:type II secretory pathway pseudopilin PulG